MTLFLNIIAGILMASGVFFFLAGAIALIRFPDVYTRLHATTKLDTLGLGLILVGLIVYDGFTLASVKLLFILFFMFLTSPTAAHALARSAYKSGVKLFGENPIDKYGDSQNDNS